MDRITKEFLISEITNVEYHRIGATLTVCAITTKDGFTFTGESACVNPDNFDEELGKRFAHENAFEKMWMPYGFWLNKVLNAHSNLPTNEGWNGKGMWLMVVRPDDDVAVPPRPTYAVAGIVDDVTNGCLPWIGMKTVDNKFVPWLASQTDVLAEYWLVVV